GQEQRDREMAAERPSGEAVSQDPGASRGGQTEEIGKRDRAQRRRPGQPEPPCEQGGPERDLRDVRLAPARRRHRGHQARLDDGGRQAAAFHEVARDGRVVRAVARLESVEEGGMVGGQRQRRGGHGGQPVPPGGDVRVRLRPPAAAEGGRAHDRRTRYTAYPPCPYTFSSSSCSFGWDRQAAATAGLSSGPTITRSTPRS